MNLLKWIAITLLVLLAPSSCATMTQPDKGNIDIRLEGIPEPCLTGTELVITVKGSNGGFYSGNLTVTGGSVSLLPVKGPESGGDATKKFKDGEVVTVTVEFVSLDPACKSYLENSVFHTTIVEGETALSSNPTKPTTPNGRQWSINFNTLHK